MYICQLQLVSTALAKGVDIVTILESTWLGISHPWDGPAPYASPPFLFLSDIGEYHIVHSNMTLFAIALKQSKFFRYWANKTVAAAVPVKVFQTPANIHFEFSAYQGVEAYLRRTRLLREEFAAVSAGFVENDAWYYTAGLPYFDIHYNGCQRRMANQINFNIMCNQDYHYTQINFLKKSIIISAFIITRLLLLLLRCRVVCL